MRSKQIIVLLSLLSITGCSSGVTQRPAAVENASPPSSASPASQPVSSTAVKARVDACAFLTSREIESVQGEALKETKLTGQSVGGFSLSQCLFELPTFTNSISLLVTQKGEGTGAIDPRKYWRDTFHEDSGKEKDKDRDREGDRDKKKEEEEEVAPPQKITGVGEEAYWMGNRVGGALYVLKGSTYIRLSVGGPPEQATKIRKSKALAQKVLLHL